jgi:hypothetical protein
LRDRQPAIHIFGRVDPATIIGTHLPDLDHAWRPTVERLVEVIMRALPDAQLERKWGQLTFTRGADWHHWICAVSPSKKTVKLVIHKGAMLDDPHRAMEGSGRYTRSIRFGTPDEIDPGVVVPILRQAAERQTEMLPSDAS